MERFEHFVVKSEHITVGEVIKDKLNTALNPVEVTSLPKIATYLTKDELILTSLWSNLLTLISDGSFRLLT